MPPPGGALRRAVVLLSGGLDSATALAMTLATGARVRTLSFDYGQRHRAELEAAAALAAASAPTSALGPGVEDHRVATIDLAAFGGSSLLRVPAGGVAGTAAGVGREVGWGADLVVPKDRDLSGTTGSGGGGGGGGGTEDDGGGTAIPNTYVPARNTIFLAYALGLAEVSRASSIVIGANAVDYSGYPDCRPAYFDAWRPLAALATVSGVTSRGGGAVSIETPLLHMTKADIVREGLRLGVDFGATHSCYDPVGGGEGWDGWGPCGRCDACQLRAAAFKEVGVGLFIFRFPYGAGSGGDIVVSVTVALAAAVVLAPVEAVSMAGGDGGGSSGVARMAVAGRVGGGGGGGDSSGASRGIGGGDWDAGRRSVPAVAMAAAGRVYRRGHWRGPRQPPVTPARRYSGCGALVLEGAGGG
ncbi:hypothetical protein MMPV_003868 [Pyropia vietnamensis]